MRFGLIGCGWAGLLRAEAIARMAEFHLVAVADKDLPRARALTDVYGAVVESDWHTLVSREDLDVVIVSTPPPFHPEMCIEALEHRKHVLCEKPLARTPVECRQILEAAERNNRLVATGFNYRFYPPIVKAREILDSGSIGELDHIRSYAGHPGGSEFTHTWVHDVHVMGGGTLLDNGIHIIDLTRYFLGEVAEVKGYVTDRVWGFSGCEDNGFALLRSPVGKVAFIQASWSEWRGYRFWIELYGTHGCVRASYPPMLTRVVWVDRSDGRRRSSIYLFPKLQLAEILRSYRWTGLQSFVQELQAFTQAIQGKKTPLALGFDGLRAVQIAHAVYRSSANEGAVRLDD
ncbi:MAG TPA: Gfo/Idh/MocA family protein [Candidatus Hypogeohydataceae bacterium YC41]